MQDYRKCHLRYSYILSLDTSRMLEYHKNSANFYFLFFSVNFVLTIKTAWNGKITLLIV